MSNSHAKITEVTQLLYVITRETFQKHPSHKSIIQLTRSLIVSVVAVIVNFAGSFVFIHGLGMPYLLAATLSYLLGLMVNYILSVRWVFAVRKVSSKHVEFIIFAVIITLGLVFNLLIIAAIVELLHASYWVALIVATIVVFFWNFIVRKKILY